MAGKKILIISPQQWNYLFLSKQHYALELARGNEVYYISYPEKKAGWSFTVVKDDYRQSVNLVHYKLPLPFRLMFHAKKIYRKVNLWRVKKVLKKITGGQPFDLAIDFGLFFFYADMNWIDARKKIFFPVDDTQELPLQYPGADQVLSVSENIVQRFRQAGINARFIHHGLSEEYAAIARKKLAGTWPEPGTPTGAPVKIGYIGNLDILFLDRDILLQTVQRFPQCVFHFYGTMPSPEAQANSPFWKTLLALPQAQFHGLKRPAELAQCIQEMDVLLLCYKPDYVRYHAENSHKIMEYLSTGKTVVSTNISVYRDSDLLEMSPKDRNEELPAMLEKVIDNINTYNSRANAVRRMEFALQHTYRLHAQQILQDSVV